MFGYDHPKLTSYRELLEPCGAPISAGLKRSVADVEPDDAGVHRLHVRHDRPSEGRAGHARQAPRRHRQQSSDHYPTLDDKEHRTVVYLPLCHVLGRDVAVTLPLIIAARAAFRRRPGGPRDHAVRDGADGAVHRAALSAEVRLAGAGRHPAIPRRLKRVSYELAMRFARAHARRRWSGESRALRRTRSIAACHAAVFRPILNKLGFDKLELVVSGGAPLPAETMALWQMCGVNVVEMYGQTETAGGIIAGQRGPFPRPGDVGTVPDGWEVKLADDGEVAGAQRPICSKATGTTPEATAARLKADDGCCDRRYRRMARRRAAAGRPRARLSRHVRRQDDLAVVRSRTSLRASPYVAEAVVFGHGRKYLTALIEIDSDTVADWARSQRRRLHGLHQPGAATRRCTS